MVPLAQGGMTAPQGPVVNPKAGDPVDPKAAQRNAAADFAALFAALSGDPEALVPTAAGGAPLTPGTADAKPNGASSNAVRRPNATLAATPWVEMPAIVPPIALPTIALAGTLPPDAAMAAALLQTGTMSAADPLPVSDMPPGASSPDPAGMSAVVASVLPQIVPPMPAATPPQAPAAAGLAAMPPPAAAIASIPLPAQPAEAGQSPEAAPPPAVPTTTSLSPAPPVAPTPAMAPAMTAALAEMTAAGQASVAGAAAPGPATPQVAMPPPIDPATALPGAAGNAPPPVVTAQATSQPLPPGVVLRPAGAADGVVPTASPAPAPSRVSRDTAPTRGMVVGKPQVTESRADGLPILTEALVGVAADRRGAPGAEAPHPDQADSADKATVAPVLAPPPAVSSHILPDVVARPHDIAQPTDFAAALASSAATIVPQGAPPPAAALPATMAPLPPQLAAEARQQVALRVASAVSSGVDTVSVDLRPPELGRVEIRLTFHESSVQVVVAAERATTYEAFRQDRAHLEQQLAQAGFDLGGGALDLRHGGLPREREPEPPKPSGTATAAPVEGPDEGAADQSAAERRRLSNSLIDFIA